MFAVVWRVIESANLKLVYKNIQVNNEYKQKIK